MRYTLAIIAIVAIVVVIIAFVVKSRQSMAPQWRPISVGDVTLQIPDPPGFRPITLKMGTLLQLTKLTVPLANEEFFYYIAESEIPEALRGELPQDERKFRLQMDKEDIDASISQFEFLAFKQVVKAHRDATIEKVAEEVAPGISPMDALPIHEETDYTLAWSAYAKSSGRDQSANATSSIFVVTSTLVHVKGKVLFLYAYAEDGGLEWSRQMSKQWVDSIIAANEPSISTD